MSPRTAEPGPARVRLGLCAASLAGIALAAGLVVHLLRSGVLRDVDDDAWAVAVAHRYGFWGDLTSVVSDLTPSLGGGAALLVVAALLTVHTRRWTPLAVAGGALLLLGVAVASGKLLLHQGAVSGPEGVLLPGPRFPSGPATTAVVVGGVGLLLLCGQLRPLLYRALCVLVPVVVATIGVSEVFLGQHRLSDVLASGVLGLALLLVVWLVAVEVDRMNPVWMGGGSAVSPPALLLNLAARSPMARPFHRFHAWLVVRSGSRIGSRWFGGTRVLVLEVVGRRSGTPRRVPVVYVRHVDGFLITAANAGQDRAPEWLSNLRAAGSAVVHVDGRAIRVTPEVATGAERDRLWPLVVAGSPDAPEYERLAGRPLPLVLLLPADRH